MRIFLLCLLTLTSTLYAEYYVIKVGDLDFDGSRELLERAEQSKKHYGANDRLETMQVRVPLDVIAYIAPPEKEEIDKKDDLHEGNSDGVLFYDHEIAIEVDAGQKFNGKLDANSFDDARWITLDFSFDTAKVKPVRKADFDRVRSKAAEMILSGDYLGRQWFSRYVEKEEVEELELWESTDLMGYLANTPAEVENLVIEIPSIESENRSIPIEDLLKNLPDFTSRKKEPNELKEELSAVEKVVPFDQFILFAKDANSALQFIDDSKNLLIDTLQGSINDYSIESIYQYYEEQIGIKSKDLLKSETIKSVAITSGDESFMLGTSIAVIVESEDSQNLFQELIKSRKGATDARLEEDSSANWAESVLLSPNGLTSSYIGKKENIIILSNNKNQFDRLKEVCHGKRKSLEQSDEYKLFISKNKKELDGGWFYITDDAMSRISSPAMRIAAYRRALALAVFQRCEYHHLAGEAWDKVSGLDRLGKLEVQNGKLRSEVLHVGHLLKPLSDWEVTNVTAKERDIYVEWASGYGSDEGLRGLYFAYEEGNLKVSSATIPILQKKPIGAWLTNKLTSAKAIAPMDNDLISVSLSLDPNWMLTIMEAVANTNALDFRWMSGVVTLRAAQSPLSEIYKIVRTPSYYNLVMKEQLGHSQLGVRVERVKTVEVKPFIEALEKLCIKAGGEVEHKEFKKTKYLVYKNFNDEFGDAEFCLTVMPDVVLMGIGEDTLIEMIAHENHIAGANLAEIETNPFVLQGDIVSISEMINANYKPANSRNVVPFLNEVIKVLPEGDRKNVLKNGLGKFFCPGGKGYRWNEKEMTMESVVYGYPGRNKFEDVLFKSNFKKFEFLLSVNENAIDMQVILKKGEDEFSIDRVVDEGEGKGVESENLFIREPGVKSTYKTKLINFAGEGDETTEDSEVVSFQNKIMVEKHKMLRLYPEKKFVDVTKTYRFDNGIFQTKIEFEKEHLVSNYLDGGWRIMPKVIKIGYRDVQKYKSSFQSWGKLEDLISYSKFHFVAIEDVKTDFGIIPDCHKLHFYYYHSYNSNLSIQEQKLWLHPDFGIVKSDADWEYEQRYDELTDIVFPDDKAE